jgi:hypothetical protein
MGPMGLMGPCCTGPTGAPGFFDPNAITPGQQISPGSLYFVPHDKAPDPLDWEGVPFDESAVPTGSKHIFVTKKEFRLAYQNGRDGPTGFLDCCGEGTGPGRTGPQGPQGPAGPQGIRGPQGVQGPQGEDGDDGIDGANGADGKTGPTGPAGPAGPTGQQGPEGPQGEKGIDGIIGKDGITGPTGPAGKTGLKGDKGDRGLRGLRGIQGPQGEDGDDGADGVDGADGKTGPTGPAGPAGKTGLKGDKGDKGLRGIQGSQGPQGEDGDDGVDGVDGINGADGKTGPTGPAGPAGATGPIGLQGVPGTPGEDGVSDKSCIVDTKSFGYRAFSCIEAPEVLFFDVITATLKNTQYTEIDVDPIFTESCVENSIKVISTSADHTCSIAAKLKQNKVQIKIIPIGSCPEKVEVNAMISGTRKDFQKHRLAQKTQDQYLRNENFWKTIGQKNFITEK